MVDVEMKLQMVSEETAASLEDQSAAALRRVPCATLDVLGLRDNAVSLRNSVADILDKLKRAEGSSAEFIAALAKVDTVKQGMEAAYGTLQASIFHYLSSSYVNFEVAEFANIRKQFEVLGEWLDTMVQPPSYRAISNHKVDVAQDLRGILIRIGRFKSLEQHHTKNETERLSSSNELQSNSPAALFPSWLPSFYDELPLYLEQEWKWCMVAFPDDYKTLVPKLLVETMAAQVSSFISRIHLATGEVVPETKALAKGILDILSGDLPKGSIIPTKHLEALIELHNMTGIFPRNIQHLFSETDLRILADTLKAVYFPYESFKQRGAESTDSPGSSVADCLTSGYSLFEASLRATLARLSTSLSVLVFGSSLDQNQFHVTNNEGNREPSLGGMAALDVAVVRLVDVPEKARKLFNL
ncbi:hypothetical protein DITRI_Ditri07aG0057200 [Diplodiscus trichospermus]